MVIGDGPGIPKREGSVGRTWGARAAVLDDEFNDAARRQHRHAGLRRLNIPASSSVISATKSATRATLRDGWFVTSDLARMDADGYVFIMGRADDCFKSKGVLIAPRELEDAILGLGAFEEACVFPMPDGEIGNRIGAAVVPRANVADAPVNTAESRRCALRPHRAVQAAASRASAVRIAQERQRQDPAQRGRATRS